MTFVWTDMIDTPRACGQAMFAIPVNAMTASSIRSRTSVRVSARVWLFASFAILALFGMLALATWHDAKPHVHDAGYVVSVNGDHPEQAPAEKPDDMADLMHLVAHAVLQTIDVPAPLVVAALMKPAAEIWTLASAKAAHSLDPSSILRPPRG